MLERARDGIDISGLNDDSLDAVADDGPVPSVHEQREDRVHHIVVERPATAGPVSFPAPGGELDLQERTLLRVRLSDVDDEEVREHELGQRVRAILASWPVQKNNPVADETAFADKNPVVTGRPR